jgi:hypothetical protein
MHKLFRPAALAIILVCLASCSGGQQDAQTQGLGGARTAAVLSGGADYESLVQQLYVGYFGRPADPGGLANYVDALRNANAPTTVRGLFEAYSTNEKLRRLLDSFATSEESRQLYPACDWIGCDYQWISAVYQGLFSREPDIEGGEFWAKALNAKGSTRAQVLLSVLAGAQTGDADLLARKVRVAAQFTRALDAQGKGGSYSGQLAAAIARELMLSVPGLSDDPSAQASIDATIERLAAMSTGAFEEVDPGSRKIVLLASAARFTDNAARLSAFANALADDLNQRRPAGPRWDVSVARAAGTVDAIRTQLKGYDGAILVGRVPVPSGGGGPFLDAYRLPDCPDLAVDVTGAVLTASAMHSADPRCQNGAVVSVLRGTTAQGESAEIAAKLDQMIAYHRAGNAANADWTARARIVGAGWFGGPEAQWSDLSARWSEIGMYASDAVRYVIEGASGQRRDAFLDCIGQGNEMCRANLHGSSGTLVFEGPGVPGEFYSSDSLAWYPASLSAQSVKAKFIDLVSCSTQDFLVDNSVGTSLLMRGNALLTHGMVAVTLVSNVYEEDVIRNEYTLLQNGSTFAEALYGRMEGTPSGIQGDPYITMRPVPSGPQPRLVIDGMHYQGGVQTVPLSMPDAAGGASVIRVVSFSNRGDADLHLRIGSLFAVTGVDYGTAHGGEWEFGFNAQYETELKQIYSDGTVLAWPAFALEQNGGVMPLTLKPGQSIGITYKLNVRTGADGKPKRTGLYTAQLAVSSDDPGSRRVYLAVQGRVR